MLKELKIELTNQCPRNCKHCSSSATCDTKKLKKLDFSDVKRMIKEAREMGVETVVFTGGEPLMYEQLADLVKLVSSLEMKTTIYSFAYRNNQTLEQYRTLIKNGLNKIVYSLADTLSDEKDLSIYEREEFFDQVFKNNDAVLGFHYTVSKDSIGKINEVVSSTINIFQSKSYFDKVSLLRFVPHGKGSKEMDLSKEEILSVKDLYYSIADKSKIRLGSPWNILGIENSPCIIADEIMIIGFDGVGYPCDSIKYFNGLGTSGNIKYNSLREMYDSEYFQNIRTMNTTNTCINCNQYSICKSGCIGQKIIANYVEDGERVAILKKCINSRDPQCLNSI